MQAQAEVYQLFSSKLFALGLKYCRNKADAEDVLQDSFIRAFEKIHQFNDKGSFEGWLKRIVINTALQKYREKSPLQLVKNNYDVENEEAASVTIEEENVDIDFLFEIIQQLPDRYRLVFNLYVLDNYSHKEIAEMLSISEGTSKSNLSRARKLLKQKLQIQQKVSIKA